MSTEGGQGRCLNAKCERCEQISPCEWLFALDILSRLGAECCLLLWGIMTPCLIWGEYFIDIKCYLDAYPDVLVGTTAVFIICDPWRRTLNFLELSFFQWKLQDQYSLTLYTLLLTITSGESSKNPGVNCCLCYSFIAT